MGMVNENIIDLTSGIRSLAEEVSYLYAEVERKHRFRFLFDPLRLLSQRKDVEKYLHTDNPYPPSVEIDPSNACNHDCDFCIYHSLHSKERSEMLSEEVLIKLVEDLAEIGVSSLLFVGGGEPMTHAKTVDAIELAASNGMSVGLVTNGSLIRDKYQARLKAAATYVRFSLDAATPETHLELHKNNDLARIIDNLRGLVNAEGNCTIGTGFFINEKNVHEIVASAELVKSIGADYIQFKSYSGIPLSTKLQKEMLNELKKVISLSDASFDVHITERIFENHVHQVRGYSKCHWQAFKPVVNADGSVFLCAQKRTDKTGIIGNLYENSFNSTLSSSDFC